MALGNNLEETVISDGRPPCILQTVIQNTHQIAFEAT